MRFVNIDTVVFTDINGNNYSVKDFRTLPSYQTAFVLPINSSDMIDEIASRDEVYGEFAEDQCYKIFEANVLKLTEYDFNLSQLRELIIPY